MQFDYITINGLDQNTKERISKDIESSGCKGSKSNYVVSLMNDGLDKREGLRAISSKEEIKTLDERLSSQKEILDSLLEKECEGKIDEQVLKKLLIRMYWMLHEIAEKNNAYVDDIINGSMDELPLGLLNEQERMNKAYHG